MLPIDLVFVRHGQSEGNVANRASRNRDNSFFTPEFLERHSRTFRLTDKGIAQAEAAGEWLRANVPTLFDRFYVSDYIRAKETAVHLHLPHAFWRQEFHLRERDKAPSRRRARSAVQTGAEAVRARSFFLVSCRRRGIDCRLVLANKGDHAATLGAVMVIGSCGRRFARAFHAGESART